MTMRTKILTALLACAALMGSVAMADAKILELRVRGGGTSSITTNNYGLGTTASVSDSGLINSITYAASGTVNEGTNHISLNISTLGTNTTNTVKVIQYQLTATGLTNQPSIQGWQDLFSGINPPGGSGTLSDALVRVYYDAANVKYGTNQLVYDSGFPGGCGFPPAYSCTPNGPISLPAVFSLTAVVTIVHKAGSLNQPVTSNNNFQAVPEPTSLALLGSGLLLAGWMFRRRQSNKAA